MGSEMCIRDRVRKDIYIENSSPEVASRPPGWEPLPYTIVTGLGTQFESKDFKDYLYNFEVKKIATISHRLSSNDIIQCTIRICERLNVIFQRKIKHASCKTTHVIEM